MAKKKRTQKACPDARCMKTLPKTPTRIAGLDEILEGGLPAGRATVVTGSPGCGKTVLGLEFLYRGALAGDPGIFVGFEERPDALRRNAATFGWDLAALERDHKLFLLQGRVTPAMVISGDFDLHGLLAIIDGKAREMGATRVVFDALELVLQLWDEPKRVRSELHALGDWLSDRSTTSVLTLSTATGADPAMYERFFHSMADCALVFDQRVEDHVTTRRMRVIKYRGSGFGRNEYPYVVTAEGVKVLPITTVELKHQPLGGKMTSGIPRLDALLGGGYARGSCTLLAGLQGTGKTLLASTFTQAACARGEKVLYISFEESADALMGNVRSAGIDLRPAVKSGALHFITAYPESLGAEEHLLRKLNHIEALQPDHVIVDAISACERMGSRRAAFDFLMRLLNACKERGITMFMINQTTGNRGDTSLTGNNISSMVDTVLFLCYAESRGETNRTIEVMKARGSAHSNQVREFVISDKGLDLLDVYVGEGGLLTGVARQEQEAKEAYEDQRRIAEIEAKERELAHLKASLDAESEKLRAAIEAAETDLAAYRLERDMALKGRAVRGKMRGADTTDAAAPRPKRARARGKGGRR